jgi:fructokinase
MMGNAIHRASACPRQLESSPAAGTRGARSGYGRTLYTQTMNAPLLGAIDAGGTKFQCVLARGCEQVLLSQRIQTREPDATLRDVFAFFEDSQATYGGIEAFGIGAFGPLDLDPDSASYGHILSTPKHGWSNADLVGSLQRRFGKPVAIDTDVNAAALGEIERGAGRGLRSLVYVTVGTGVGGGAVIAGSTLRGLMHPEMGHISVHRDRRDHEFPGVCPFHGDCLEGLVCGPAIRERWGVQLDALGPGHEAWSIIGNYLGQLMSNLALMLSCERIVLGGGVMTGGALLPHVRASARGWLNGYLPPAALRGDLQQYIVAPGLGERSGVMGALSLALRLLA